MSRLLMGFALLAAACSSHKSFESVCANQVPPPEACMTACDPSSGTGDATCPGGFHCAVSGKCDALCTAGGTECGSGYSCTTDGFCTQDPGDDAPIIDADCPAVHFTAAKTTPTVELLLDFSGSMKDPYGNGASPPRRYDALKSALVDPTNGVVTKLQNAVGFGAAGYTGSTNDCPHIYATPDRKLGNFTEIKELLDAGKPLNNTPTGESIDKIRADFAAHPPAANSPAIIVLATDGLPDTCADENPNTQAKQDAANAVAVKAAQDAYTANIKLFFLFVGDANQAGMHPQRMANAGAGKDVLTGTAPFFAANNPADLTAAFNTIVGGVVSCDLKLSGKVDPTSAQTGTVALNGNALTYGTDWTVDADGVTLHLLGTACNTLKTTNNPTVDATFNCGSVIY